MIKLRVFKFSGFKYQSVDDVVLISFRDHIFYKKVGRLYRIFGFTYWKYEEYIHIYFRKFTIFTKTPISFRIFNFSFKLGVDHDKT
jgi:hypothetical protein